MGMATRTQNSYHYLGLLSGADAKLAPALRFLLSPAVFSVRESPVRLECILVRGKHICQTSEAQLGQETNVI